MRSSSILSNCALRCCTCNPLVVVATACLTDCQVSFIQQGIAATTRDLEPQLHKILAYDKIFCSTIKEFSFHRTLRRAAGFLSKYQYCSPLKETRPSPLVDHYHSLSSRTYFFLSSVEKSVPFYVYQYHSLSSSVLFVT